MKIEISYPGQSVQIVDAQPHIIQHYLTKDYDLPFHRVVSTIRPATLWSRWNKDEEGKGFWDVNHLEDGFCKEERPNPKHPSHDRSWAGGDWKREYVKLINDGYLGADKVHHIL